MNSETTTIEKQKDFHWLDPEAYLFDIDGTLLNTRDGIHRNALKVAMREVYGIEAPLEGVIFHGKTDLGILRTALARVGIVDGVFDAKLPQALAVVSQFVSERKGQLVAQVCPGIPEALAVLKQHGKRIGIASGNLESVGWQKVEAAGLRSFFSSGYFSDHCERRTDIFRQAALGTRRPSGETASLCFVGDTPDDIEAAQAAAARVIAVSTGIYKRDELAALNPDVCVDTFLELLAPRSG